MEDRARARDYIKGKVIGGVSPRHFEHFFCLLLLYTYQYMLCIVAIVDYSHVHHVQYKISELTIACCCC